MKNAFLKTIAVIALLAHAYYMLAGSVYYTDSLARHYLFDPAPQVTCEHKTDK